jgi:hypothetical protein
MSALARRGSGLVLLAALAAAMACARIRPLEGGPIDRESPHLLTVTPRDSTTNIDRMQRFTLEFSEDLGTTGATAAVRFEPAVRIAAVRVKGPRLEVTLADSLPPDTTVVLVVGKELQDRKGRDNKLPGEVVLVYATGAHLRGASVYGKVTLKGAANPKLAVVWEPVGNDSLRAPRRRGPAAGADLDGLFHLAGIPPGRPFQLRAFQDANGDLHPSEGELAAVYPETLRLGPGEVRRGVSWNIVDPNEAGTITGLTIVEAHVTGPVAVALRLLTPYPGSRPASRDSLAKAESLAVRADTLRPRPLPVTAASRTPWAVAYDRLEPRGWRRREWTVVYASPRGDYSVRVPPGRHALAAFVDAHRDSVPGLYVAPDSTQLLWEPFVLGDTVQVDPGGKLRARTMSIRAP